MLTARAQACDHSATAATRRADLFLTYFGGFGGNIGA